jgi:hypothetical protein
MTFIKDGLEVLVPVELQMEQPPRQETEQRGHSTAQQPSPEPQTAVTRFSAGMHAGGTHG